MLNRFQDVFKSFQSNNVKYLVIGGIAAVVHGVPRATFDLDILIEATRDNAERLLAAFVEAHLGTATLTTPENVLAHEITVFNDRLRIDVQTSTPGLTFESAWLRKTTMHYAGQQFYVVSLPDLLASKRASGRQIDLEDVRMLEAGQGPSEPV